MAKNESKKSEDKERTTQDVNFDNARKTAQINHDADVERNTVSGYEGVEVRDAKPVEVINPVRNTATGELEDDTRTLKQTPEEQVGAGDSAPESDSKSDESK